MKQSKQPTKLPSVKTKIFSPDQPYKPYGCYYDESVGHIVWLFKMSSSEFHDPKRSGADAYWYPNKAEPEHDDHWGLKIYVRNEACDEEEFPLPEERSKISAVSAYEIQLKMFENDYATPVHGLAKVIIKHDEPGAGEFVRWGVMTSVALVNEEMTMTFCDTQNDCDPYVSKMGNHTGDICAAAADASYNLDALLEYLNGLEKYINKKDLETIREAAVCVGKIESTINDLSLEEWMDFEFGPNEWFSDQTFDGIMIKDVQSPRGPIGNKVSFFGSGDCHSSNVGTYLGNPVMIDFGSHFYTKAEYPE